jgi:hypothetical protein
LFCSKYAGTKPIFFQWSKNGQILSSKPELNFKIDNSADHSLLTIENIERNDAGNYSCIIRNAFGTDSQLAQLIVKGLLENLNYYLC